MKKRKLKNILNSVAISAIGAGAITGVYLAVDSATSRKKYGSYSDKFFRGLNDIEHKNNLVKIKIKDAYMDFGAMAKVSFKKEMIDFQNANTIDAQDEIAKNIDKNVYDTRKSKGVNPKIVIVTDILTITNNYFDVFGAKDTMSFFNWFMNNISWGPDILTLSNFNILRGLNADGTQIVLGGHNGTREKTNINFYPDSFFGMQTIYNSTSNSILVDPSNINKPPESVSEKFVSNFTQNNLLPNKDKILSMNFENDLSLDELFSVSTLENYVEIFSKQTLHDIEQSICIQGSRKRLLETIKPGNFPTLNSFITYAHGHADSKGHLKSQDTYITSEGKKITVFPKRYFRRLLLRLYLISFSADGPEIDGKTYKSLYELDFIRKQKGGDLINSMPDNISDLYSWDVIDPRWHLTHVSGLLGISQPDEITTDPNVFPRAGAAAQYPLVFKFTGFSKKIPIASEEKIEKLIKELWQINTYKVIDSSEVDFYGNHYKIPLYEKYMGEIELMEDMLKSDGWSPLVFDENKKASIAGFVPNIYLWLRMKRNVSALDYIDYNNFSITPAQRYRLQKEIDANSDNTKTHIGIEWLKYVTAHEYGHHQTLNYLKDLSETTTETKIDGIYDTSKQVFAQPSPFRHSYSDAYNKNWVQEYLRARSGFDGTHAGIIDPSKMIDHTWTYDKDSTKDSSFFTLVHNDGTVESLKLPNSFTIGERSVDEIGDFANSWRGFKSFNEIVNVLPINSGNYEESASLIGSTFLLNALDQSTYTLNPSIENKVGGFKKNLDGSIDYKHLINPIHPDIANYEVTKTNYLNGWNGRESTTLNTLFKLTSFSGGSNSFVTPFYKDGSNELAMRAGTLDERNIHIAQDFVSNFVNSTYDSRKFDGTLDINFSNDYFLSPTNDKRVLEKYPILKTVNSFKDRVIVDQGEKYSSHLKHSDYRIVSNMIINLKYKIDPTTKKTIYLSPTSSEYNLPTTKSKDVYVVSGSWIRTAFGDLINPIMETAKEEMLKLYKEKKGIPINDLSTHIWSIPEAERQNYFLTFVANELNKETDKLITEDAPLKSGQLGSEEFGNWIKSLDGVKNLSKKDNEIWKNAASSLFFSLYWKNVGRFINSIPPSDSDLDAFRPTAMLVFAMANSSGRGGFNDVYNNYLSSGAYPYFGQLNSDYQMSFPEAINRDLQQLQYAPSSVDLQDNFYVNSQIKHSNEATDMAVYKLPPLFTNLWSNNTLVQEVDVINGTGAIDITGGKLEYIYDTKTSGWWLDWATRDKLNWTFYDKEHPDSIGLPINNMGKVFVNYIQRLFGIDPDKDISGMFLDNETGFGNFYGYMDLESSQKYKYLLFIDEATNEKVFLPILFGYSNNFFYDHLGVVSSKKSMLDGKYLNNGKWINWGIDKKQVGWTTDFTLLNGYSNALLKENHSYKMLFTTDKSQVDSRKVKLGMKWETVFENGKYVRKHTPIKQLLNNGFDLYTATFIIEANYEKNTIIRIRG